MDFISPGFFSALVAIIIIDLVLAGDNAIVIALAARKLPKEMQRQAIMWGTFGAIAVRVVMTLVVVALLEIPGLQLVGGLLLIWIAYKLLAADNDHDEDELARSVITTTFWAAIRTIIVADAVMGLDNVLGVAGAAAGSYLLVVLGLLISIPIMVGGSTLILRLVDRYPVTIYIGAGVLAWTSAKMIVEEPLLKGWFDANAWGMWLAYLLIIGGVLLGGWLHNRSRTGARQSA